MNDQKAMIEGLIFLSGEEGLTIQQLQSSLQQDDVQSIFLDIEALKTEYQQSHHGFELVEYAHRFKFVTKETIYPYGARLFAQTKADILSSAALETLAIVAYKQPVTRVEIEDIRGVGCDMMLRKLQARGLIEAKEHLDVVGKPLLYTVTEQFLDAFQLETLDELPPLPTHAENEELFEMEEE